jgi:hypothetical protein
VDSRQTHTHTLPPHPTHLHTYSHIHTHTHIHTHMHLPTVFWIASTLASRTMECLECVEVCQGMSGEAAQEARKEVTYVCVGAYVICYTKGGFNRGLIGVY